MPTTTVPPVPVVLVTGACRGLGRGIAVQLAAKNVQVIKLRRGIMTTDMTAGAKEKHGRSIAGGLVSQKRCSTAEDAGLAVRSIIAGRFPYSTGAVIAIDGGLHLRRF